MSRLNGRLELAYERTGIRTTIADYLRDAEAGRAGGPDGRPYSPAGLRSLRRALAHIEAAEIDPAALGAMDAAALERLGRQIVDREGLPAGRLDSIVNALLNLSEYAAGDARVDPPRMRKRPVDEPAQPVADTERPTPTLAMLTLGARAGVWTERILVIAFVLAVIGLALELA